MTYKEFHKLQEKYNKPRDPKQQEKYWEYKEKIREIMKKPPNDKKTTSIGINELINNYMTDSMGYFYDPEEQVWCVYDAGPIDRSNDVYLTIYRKKDSEEEAFQDIYETLEENVKRYERELERERNDRMTKEEFLEWFGQENREAGLAEKGPYQILWDRQPREERYAVGYYKKINSPYIQEAFGDEWIAYVIINGKYEMECPYSHETRAIYMMRYWIQLIMEGYFD